MNSKSHDQFTEEERRAQLYPIILREYDPAWPRWFAEEKEAILHLVDAESIVRISHIGSTAVQGLMAKPTVDVLLEISETADIEKLKTAFSMLGYFYLDENTLTMPFPPPHLVFFKGYTPTGFAEKVFHVHVRYPADWDELHFRDYLIAHPETAAEYAALKRRLFNEFKFDRDGYSGAKSEFVKEVMRKARNE